MLRRLLLLFIVLVFVSVGCTLPKIVTVEILTECTWVASGEGIQPDYAFVTMSFHADSFEVNASLVRLLTISASVMHFEATVNHELITSDTGILLVELQ